MDEIRPIRRRIEIPELQGDTPPWKVPPRPVFDPLSTAAVIYRAIGWHMPNLEVSWVEGEPVVLGQITFDLKVVVTTTSVTWEATRPGLKLIIPGPCRYLRAEVQLPPDLQVTLKREWFTLQEETPPFFNVRPGATLTIQVPKPVLRTTL